MPQLTRREFLGYGENFGKAYVGLRLHPIFGRFNEPDQVSKDQFSFLKDVYLPPEHLRLPRELRGILVNMPEAWNSPRDPRVPELVDQALTLRASTIRIIIDNRLTNANGQYNKDVTEKVKRFASLVEERSKGALGLLVMLYNQSDRTIEEHPDEVGIKLAPFYDKQARTRLKDRMQYLVAQLKGVPNIVAWGVGNEMEIVDRTPESQKKKLMTEFFGEMIAAIRIEDPTRWIVTGTRKPYFVDDKPFAGKRVAFTDHPYPGFTSDGPDGKPMFDPNDVKELQEYIATMSVPLFIEEIGVKKSRTVYLPTTAGQSQPQQAEIPVPDDEFLVDFLAQSVKAATWSPSLFRPTLYAGGYGFWKLDLTTNDGFDVTPITHPKLVQALPTLDKFLKS